MVHVVRRMLPLLVGPVGALLGSLTGVVLYRMACAGLDVMWEPWLGWRWLIGFAAYPLVGAALAAPFLYVYPGPPGPWRSEDARAAEIHVRLWLAAFFAAYLPLGFGVAWARWWGAPVFTVPFTDVMMFPGMGGLLPTAMAAVALLSSFCGAAVERMLRGTPRALRLLVGPPAATVLAMVAVPAAVVVAAGVIRSWPAPEPYAPLLEAFIDSGWQVDGLVVLFTVVDGGIAGALATLFVTLPVLDGVRDLDVRGSRRRWAAPLAATAVGGTLCLAGFAHGFGSDVLSAVTPVIRPGQGQINGTLVAPWDADVYELHAPRRGVYLLELPAPGPDDRYELLVPGFELPRLRADRRRWLIPSTASEAVSELTVGPTYPLRGGAVDYSGPMVFRRIESHATEAWAPIRAELEPGERGQWTVDLARGPRELRVRAGDRACWTLLAPTASTGENWGWIPGFPTVLLQVEVGGQVVRRSVLGVDQFGQFSESMTVVGARGGGGDEEVVLRLIPAARPGEILSVTVIGEAPPDGVSALHPARGATVLVMRSGDRVELRPEPGGSCASLRRVGPAEGRSLVRMDSTGAVGREVPDVLLLLSDSSLMLLGEASEREEPLVFLLGS